MTQNTVVDYSKSQGSVYVVLLTTSEYGIHYLGMCDHSYLKLKVTLLERFMFYDL